MQGAADSNIPDTPDTPASPDERPRFRPVPWQHLETPYDVEVWIEEHNRSMQDNIRATETGVGICFTLAEGGDIYMQTSADGAVVLDVTPDAAWVAPLISAATGCEAPDSSLWILPDDKLIQLIVGLSSLVASTLLVVGHDFGLRRRSMRQGR
ncbi:hypothetical protein [Janthinobacterium tructae]|uniref:hypothetical protein n=1 Tax=Janthinobacterium tructae TaxID=2590869 RepID=UPI00249B863A|nr:hypothetical protein [Janthinobacterium tructae]MDI3296550.1 hypothetical protein [Janthinobacterium tructae]